jgi:peroxiredoxin
MSRLEVGAKAPSFSLTDQDGREVSSASLKGERYVIYF